jgi:hypothetical protein
MANVKISALPSYTGTAADLRWFVMNNSGETETFKFSGYTSPFKSVGTNNRIINAWDLPSSVTGDYSMILGGSGNTITAGNKNAILYGENATNAGSAGCVIASQGGGITDGFGNGIFGGINTCGGNYCATIGGISNIIGGTFNDRDVIAGGQNNIIYAASNSFIGGGSENDVYGATIGVVAGYNNTISTGNLVFVAATQDNTITQPGYTYALIGGGYNTVNNANNSAGNAMYSSYFCSDTTINDNSVLGNSNNWFAGSRNCTQSGYGKHNWIANSYNSTITNNPSTDANQEWFNSIISSRSSTILTSVNSTIVGGEDNTLNTTGFGFIGGGKGNTLSGGTNYSSIIGGLSNENYGNYSGIFNGTLNKINNPTTEYSTIVGAYSSQTEGDNSHIFGGIQNQIFNEQSVILGGRENIIAAGSSQAEIIGSRNCIITGTTTDCTIINSISSVIPNGIDRAVMLGTSGRTATVDSATFVENLVVFNYAALDFANDTAAAAGGVVLGQVYHNNGALRIRIV